MLFVLNARSLVARLQVDGENLYRRGVVLLALAAARNQREEHPVGSGNRVVPVPTPQVANSYHDDETPEPPEDHVVHSSNTTPIYNDGLRTET